MSGADSQEINTCPNCRALMPSEMRFCRACGCRLGEGIEEYTETVRFASAPRTAPAGKARATASAASPKTSPTSVKDWGAMARGMRQQALMSATTGLGKMKIGRACKRVPRWFLWIFIPIFIFSMIGGQVSIRRRMRSSGAAAGAANSYLGSQYKTANGGAFIRDTTPPGSAADKAGLIGGDTIISFDGKAVKSDDDLSRLLSATPVGKTVDVTFIRDGETKMTKVTTVSEDENGSLEEKFNDRPKGFLGVEDDKFKLVQVPGKNIYGVQMNEVYKNRPGYIAGLRDGDIVIEFNGIPIRTIEEFNMRIDRAQPDSTVKVVVVRGGETLEIPVKMGEE